MFVNNKYIEIKIIPKESKNIIQKNIINDKIHNYNEFISSKDSITKINEFKQVIFFDKFTCENNKWFEIIFEKN